MNTDAMMKLGLAAAVLYGIYRFAPNAALKAMALGVGGVLVAKTVPIPYVSTALLT